MGLSWPRGRAPATSPTPWVPFFWLPGMRYELDDERDLPMSLVSSFRLPGVARRVPRSSTSGRPWTRQRMARRLTLEPTALSGGLVEIALNVVKSEDPR